MSISPFESTNSTCIEHFETLMDMLPISKIEILIFGYIRCNFVICDDIMQYIVLYSFGEEGTMYCCSKTTDKIGDEIAQETEIVPPKEQLSHNSVYAMQYYLAENPNRRTFCREMKRYYNSSIKRAIVIYEFLRQREGQQSCIGKYLYAATTKPKQYVETSVIENEDVYDAVNNKLHTECRFISAVRINNNYNNHIILKRRINIQSRIYSATQQDDFGATDSIDIRTMCMARFQNKFVIKYPKRVGLQRNNSSNDCAYSWVNNYNGKNAFIFYIGQTQSDEIPNNGYKIQQNKLLWKLKGTMNTFQKQWSQLVIQQIKWIELEEYKTFCLNANLPLIHVFVNNNNNWMKWVSIVPHIIHRNGYYEISYLFVASVIYLHRGEIESNYCKHLRPFNCKSDTYVVCDVGHDIAIHNNVPNQRMQQAQSMYEMNQMNQIKSISIQMDIQINTYKHNNEVDNSLFAIQTTYFCMHMCPYVARNKM